LNQDPPSGNQRFGRKYRIAQAADFKQVFSSKERSSDRYVLMLVTPNNRDYARLGMAVAKKNFHAAVDRNRIKRLIREAFRYNKEALAGRDVVVMPRRNIASMSNESLAALLNRHFKKVFLNHNR